MRTVETSAIIHTSPENALKAFYEPQMLKGWWGVEKSLIDLRPGGLYILAWQVSETGIHYVSTGTIDSFTPARELRVRNMAYLTPDKPFLGPMGLTVTVEEREDGTNVNILQDGYQEGEIWDWYYQAVVEAWPNAMETLKSYLESGN